MAAPVGRGDRPVASAVFGPVQGLGLEGGSRSTAPSTAPGRMKLTAAATLGRNVHTVARREGRC